MALLRLMRPRQTSDRVVARLNDTLATLYAQSIHNIKSNGFNPLLIQEDTDVLLALAKARERLKAVSLEEREEDVASALAQVTHEIMEKLYTTSVSRTRLGLSNILATLVTAADQLSDESGPDATMVETVVLPSDLLLQAKTALFPAERMQIIEGRRLGTTVRLGTPTDITDESSDGHVRHDEMKLNDARLKTQKSGTFLAMCLHSHPGEGPFATIPGTSDNDLHQYGVTHSWPLLISAIMVKDGYLRLFGDAVERKLVTVAIEGAGIERIPQDEADESGTLYRVTQPVPHLTQEADTAPAEDTPPGRLCHPGSPPGLRGWDQGHLPKLPGVLYHLHGGIQWQAQQP